MKIVIARDSDQVSAFAAHFVVRQVQGNPEIVLGLATGRTMVGFYRELVARHRAGDCSFARTVTFNLDEFVNLPEDHPESYHCFMRRHLFDHVDIRRENTHIPDGNRERLLDETDSYEDSIKVHGGIDLMVLGIGRNGHIAFNEPGSSLRSRTRVKRLEPETVAALTPAFSSPGAIPRYVITAGVGTITDSRFVLMLAFGMDKAGAVEQMVEGPVAARCPASILQMHPHVFTVLDREAASRLTRKYDTVEDVLADPFEEYFWEGD
jgi:glucosamine-6-phosphate deaminase